MAIVLAQAGGRTLFFSVCSSASRPSLTAHAAKSPSCGQDMWRSPTSTWLGNLKLPTASPRNAGNWRVSLQAWTAGPRSQLGPGILLRA